MPWIECDPDIDSGDVVRIGTGEGEPDEVGEEIRVCMFGRVGCGEGEFLS